MLVAARKDGRFPRYRVACRAGGRIWLLVSHDSGTRCECRWTENQEPGVSAAGLENMGTRRECRWTMKREPGVGAAGPAMKNNSVRAR